MGTIIVLLAAFTVIAYERWQERPHVVTSLEGVSINEKLSDVVFRQGPFEKIDSKKLTGHHNHDEDRYVNVKKRTILTVRNGLVTTILYACKLEQTDLTRLNRIECNDQGDKIFEVFGDKVRVLCPKEKNEDSTLKRAYDVVEYGTRYILKQNHVESFLITETTELQSWVGINWDTCG